MVYFIHSNATNTVKIGHTRDLRSRESKFRTDNPEPLLLLGTIDGGRPEEETLHRRFSHLRTQGEWFRCTAELLIAIDDLLGGEIWDKTIWLRDDYGEMGPYGDGDYPFF